jgi:hypothetical protein
MKGFKQFAESMDHKSDNELLKISRSTHPHAAGAMVALKKRGVKVHNPATGKKESVEESKNNYTEKVTMGKPEVGSGYEDDGSSIISYDIFYGKTLIGQVEDGREYDGQINISIDKIDRSNKNSGYDLLKFVTKKDADERDARSGVSKFLKTPSGKKWTVSAVKSAGIKEEGDPTSTSDVVGTGDDVADWKTKKKKKSSVVTRHYIEVNGKRKKQTK